MSKNRCDALLLSGGVARRCILKHAHSLEEDHCWELLDRDRVVFGAADENALRQANLSTLLNYVHDWVIRPDRKIRLELEYDYNHDHVVITGERQTNDETTYTLRLDSWHED